MQEIIHPLINFVSADSSGSSRVNVINQIANDEFESIHNCLEQNLPVLAFSPAISSMICNGNLIEQVVNNVEENALDCLGMLELIRISPAANRALNLRMYS